MTFFFYLTCFSHGLSQYQLYILFFFLKIESFIAFPYTVRFKAEVKRLMELNHTHLAPILGGCSMGAQYIIWDHISGFSLFDYLKRFVCFFFCNHIKAILIRSLMIRSSPSPQEVLQISRAVASAVGYLHVNGVIHGSLKTRNIFLDFAPGDPTPRNILVKDYGFLEVKTEST